MTIPRRRPILTRPEMMRLVAKRRAEGLSFVIISQRLGISETLASKLFAESRLAQVAACGEASSAEFLSAKSEQSASSVAFTEREGTGQCRQEASKRQASPS